jgi:hypothetical protein
MTPLTAALTTTPAQLFTREGSTDFRAAPGERVGSVWRSCGRCGGAGGYQGWPGFTCYDCGGACGAYVSTSLYTAEELITLNARRDALRAKKQAVRQAADAKAAAKRDEAQRAATADLVARGLGEAAALACGIAGGRDVDLIRDLVEKHAIYGLSIAQFALLERVLSQRTDRKAADAGSRHVGTVGERRDWTLTLQGRFQYETDYGVTHGHVYRDADDNVVIYKGSTRLDGERGDTVTLKATVKAHTDREGVKQTMLSRPKVAA